MPRRMLPDWQLSVRLLFTKLLSTQRWHTRLLSAEQTYYDVADIPLRSQSATQF